MDQSRFLELIAKKKAGEISPLELIELSKLIDEQQSNAASSEMIEAIWDTPLHTGEELKSEYVEGRWQHLKKKIENNEEQVIPFPRPSYKRNALRYSAIAASIAAVAFVAVWLFKGRLKVDSPKQNIVSTKNGSRSKIQLPDGTQVWLNAGSKLMYNDSYGKSLREVQLTGEAFFDVTKDAEHPFIIHTRVLNIKVVGTAFNVKAYPDGKVTEAALLRGLIEVSFPQRPEQKFFLEPNQKISVVNNEIIFDKRKAGYTSDTSKITDEPFMSLSKISYESQDSSVIETAWINSKLTFRNERFDDLARDMERWYNVSIQFKDSSLMAKRFSGTFYHESISEALNILKLSCPFHYKLNKATNTIIIE